MIGTGIEPMSSPWKGDVLTTWLTDHVRCDIAHTALRHWFPLSSKRYLNMNKNLIWATKLYKAHKIAFCSAYNSINHVYYANEDTSLSHRELPYNFLHQ